MLKFQKKRDIGHRSFVITWTFTHPGNSLVSCLWLQRNLFVFLLCFCFGINIFLYFNFFSLNMKCQVKSGIGIVQKSIHIRRIMWEVYQNKYKNLSSIHIWFFIDLTEILIVKVIISLFVVSILVLVHCSI